MKKVISLVIFMTISISFLQGKEVVATESGRWTIWSENPAKQWEDAFVTGNGKQGSMVLGQPIKERIICVHEELFIRGWDRNQTTVPVLSDLLPQVRQLIDAGQAKTAAHLAVDKADQQLKENGAPLRWPLIPHPAFDLCLQNDQTKNQRINKYRRQLNLETGEVVVSWKDKEGEVEEHVFTSRIHNINVVYLKASKGKKLTTTLSLKETPGRSGIHFGHNLDSAFSYIQSKADENGWLSYHAKYAKDSGGYEGLARITIKGGHISREGSTLQIKNANEILIKIRITPLTNGDSSVEEQVKNELSQLSNDYKTLLTPHSLEHGTLFRRMQLDLGAATEWQNTPTEKMLATTHQKGISPLFLEQVHAMGRYLLISSSGKYPPPLQGIWGGSWKPNWIGGFVWDSNINLAISAASMSNLAECAETYHKYIKQLLPGWRLNAKNYLGCRGFIVAHYNDPLNGYLTHFGYYYPWMYWPGGAGWNIRPLYEHAMLMGDYRFMKEEVLPLYKEIGDFYEDFLVMGNDSLYHIYPSMSPENCPPNNGTMLCKDATMDVAIAREVFSLLCQMGTRFQLPSEDINKWSSYLSKLPFYRINNDGALAEWIDKRYVDVYNHRHNSHLYPIFPGIELKNCNDSLKSAVCLALEKRYAFDTTSAHGLIHLALQAARLGDIEKVYANIDRFSKRHYLYDGLITSHDPEHATYNLDGILSFPRLLMEMLIYTEPNLIEILPAWPTNYPNGNIKGMRIYGGHTLDMSWRNGKMTKINIHAENDESYELIFQGNKRNITLEKGRNYSFNEQFILSVSKK